MTAKSDGAFTSCHLQYAGYNRSKKKKKRLKLDKIDRLRVRVCILYFLEVETTKIEIYTRAGCIGIYK